MAPKQSSFIGCAYRIVVQTVRKAVYMSDRMFLEASLIIDSKNRLFDAFVPLISSFITESCPLRLDILNLSVDFLEKIKHMTSCGLSY